MTSPRSEQKVSIKFSRQPVNDAHLPQIVEFCRFARASGISSSPGQTIEALQAVQMVARTAASLVSLENVETVKFALRATLCSTKEEWDAFAELFERFWTGRSRLSAAGSRLRAIPPKPSGRNLGENRYRRSATDSRGCPSLRQLVADASQQLSGLKEDKAASGASAIERLSRIDFSQVPEHDLAELEKISLRLLRLMSCRVSRRFQRRQPRGRVDLRRTIRHNLRHGGELIQLINQSRKRRPAKLVILLDVSDSMNLYSLFLLKFAYVLGKEFRDVAAFVFSTNLVPVSGALRAPKLSGALDALSQTISGWAGGTRIGFSLHEFNKIHARRLLSHRTVFIILSDGWDTGEPELLTAELKAIKQRVSKLIWLNPLLGLADYEPITRGMSAALRYVDIFAPAHNLDSLLQLERHLRPGTVTRKNV